MNKHDMGVKRIENSEWMVVPYYDDYVESIFIKITPLRNHKKECHGDCELCYNKKCSERIGVIEYV